MVSFCREISLPAFIASVLIFFIAGLLYLLCFEHVDNLGAYSASRPETSLFIPSSFTSYRNVNAEFVYNMPNGDHEFNAKELERFFNSSAAVLESFAQRHHLRLEKYYHQAPSWEFLFRHPSGGIAKIAVQRANGTTVCILSDWWYDDFDAAMRYIKTTRVGPIPLNSELSVQLETALSELLSWRFGDWHERHTGFTSWRKTWTKEQFQRLSAEYPEPLP